MTIYSNKHNNRYYVNRVSFKVIMYRRPYEHSTVSVLHILKNNDSFVFIFLVAIHGGPP